jgi:predicted nucleic acid-binding protein
VGLIIDTSVLIATERGDLDYNEWWGDISIYISSITITELLIGVYRANTEARRIKRAAFVEHIVAGIMNLPFDEEAARVYAQISASLFAKNITLGVHDMLIAATAISNGHKVITMNEKDFKRIPGLEVISVERKQRNDKI